MCASRPGQRETRPAPNDRPRGNSIRILATVTKVGYRLHVQQGAWRARQAKKHVCCTRQSRNCLKNSLTCGEQAFTWWFTGRRSRGGSTLRRAHRAALAMQPGQSVPATEGRCAVAASLQGIFIPHGRLAGSRRRTPPRVPRASTRRPLTPNAANLAPASLPRAGMPCACLLVLVAVL